MITVDKTAGVMLCKLEVYASNAFNAYFAGALNLFFEISRPKDKEERGIQWRS